MLALALPLAMLSPSQYPPPDACDKLSPAVNMVFDWAHECPTHTLRFEYRDDGTFRVVCLRFSDVAPSKAAKKKPDPTPSTQRSLLYDDHTKG